MQDLFSCYCNYEQVICVLISEYKDLRICQSSNRLIEMEEIKRIGVGTVINKQHGIFVRNLFLKYFQIHYENQQTKDETCVLSSSITNFMDSLRHDLVQDNRTVFDKSQILVCLPLGWTEEKHKSALRALFLAAGWITKEDHAYRLIFSTYLERLVDYLQDQDHLNKKFERERRYLSCHMNETSLKLTCFQMQSAKELITVSKKLAASEFLLSPTILDDELICLLSLDAMVYNKVRDMITGIIISNGPRNTIHNKPGVHTLIGKLVKYIAYIYAADKDGRSNVHLCVVLSEHSSFFEYKSVQELLKRWTCGTFIDEILNDAHVKRFIKESIWSLQQILGRYSCLKNSPEGVQDILLHTDCETSSSFYKRLIRDVFLTADAIDDKNDFIDIFNDIKLCEGAMQKPYKMIQIANAILPPMIWNDDRNQTGPHLMTSSRHTAVDLLPSNSFYLQAHIYQSHIYFILNKIVVVSLVDGVERKATFTVQEETLGIENMIDLSCDTIWNHFQFLNLGGEGLFNSCCETHNSKTLSIAGYRCFSANFKTLIHMWSQNKCAFTDKEIDMHQTVSISDDCKCSLNISHRMVLEIGLKPAIGNVAAAIVSSLAANAVFGLYNVSALILTDGIDVFAINPYYHYHSNIWFQESLSKCLQTHQKRPVVFFGRETLMACKTLGNWHSNKKQIIGRGSYKQLSSASYGIKLFAKDIVKQGSFSGVYELEGNSYKKNRSVHAFPNLIILSKDDCLTSEGFTKTLILHNYDVRRLGLYILNSLDDDANWQRIWFPGSFRMNLLFPLTIKISPQNYSSTIKFEFTYLTLSKTPVLQSQSIIIHERLVLKHH